MTKCSLCSAPATRPLMNINGRKYHRCDCCMATFLDSTHWLSPEEEYTQYQDHKNDSADRGYRTFLSRLAHPLLKKLTPRRSGLDYGCGPGPVLAEILTKASHSVSLFDPFFYPNHNVLEHTYDFITCTETIEHFNRPAEEFARFEQMLRPGGWLGIMTCFQTEDARFSSWHYRRDPTHVTFYREATLRHIAGNLGWSCEIPVKDVALMQKPLKQSPREETRFSAP